MSTTGAGLEWREEAPSLWVRPLDRTELHYVGMQGAHAHHSKEWGMLSTLLKLETPLDKADFVAAVAEAWKWARHRHPTIASNLNDEKTTRMYRVAGAEELDAWLAETLVLHEKEDGPDAAAQYRLEMPPARRVTLHVFPATQTLLLQASHHFIDGHAILRLVDLLLELIGSPRPAAPAFGSEAQRLAPAPSIAAQFPPMTQEGRSAAQAAIGDWISGFPSSGIGASDVRQPPGHTRAQRVVLSREDTGTVLAAAKRCGLTPTHVVEAALILASRETEKRLQGSSENKNYVSCGLFSLRSFCTAAAQDEVLPYVAFLPVVVAPAPFMDTARQLKDYYTQMKARGEGMLSVIEPTLETFSAMSAGATEPNQMLSVSSFGLFEPRLRSTHGPIRLLDFEFIYEVPDPGVSGFSWTRNGQLTWSVCYNEAYHSEAKVEEWMDLARSTLLTGLNISSI